jgi:hypothetical protein
MEERALIILNINKELNRRMANPWIYAVSTADSDPSHYYGCIKLSLEFAICKSMQVFMIRFGQLLHQRESTKMILQPSSIIKTSWTLTGTLLFFLLSVSKAEGEDIFFNSWPYNKAKATDLKNKDWNQQGDDANPWLVENPNRSPFIPNSDKRIQTPGSFGQNQNHANSHNHNQNRNIGAGNNNNNNQPNQQSKGQDSRVRDIYMNSVNHNVNNLSPNLLPSTG